MTREMGRERHLYRGRRGVPEEFRERYGDRAEDVYGRTIEKVAEERAANNGGTYRETVERHEDVSDRGRRYQVRRHFATVHAHRHRLGERHHGGPCGPACRAGRAAHIHRARRH